MNGGVWPLAGRPAAAAAPAGPRGGWLAAAALGVAGVGLVGSMATRQHRDPAPAAARSPAPARADRLPPSAAAAASAVDAGFGAAIRTGSSGRPPGAWPDAPAPPVPVAAAGAAVVPVQAAAMAPVRAAATAPAGPTGVLSIRSLAGSGGLFDVDGIGVDRRQAIDALARATGTRLHGIELLPPSLGRVTVQAFGIDRGAAWQRLLDGAAVGFASACDRLACSVWLAPPTSSGPAAAAAGGGALGMTGGAPPGEQRGDAAEAQN